MKLSRTLVHVSFGLLLLAASCGQSAKKEKTDTAKEATTEAVVKVPAMNLQAAVISNNIELVKQHIEAATDIDQIDPMSGSTPLITAASFGKEKIAQVLIQAGADLSLKNNDGATALHTAAFFCRVEVVQLLLDAQADKTARNNFGATPRETVMGPFADVKPIYKMLQAQLAPLGMQFDLAEIERTRPVIAMMLQ